MAWTGMIDFKCLPVVWFEGTVNGEIYLDLELINLKPTNLSFHLSPRETLNHLPNSFYESVEKLRYLLITGYRICIDVHTIRNSLSCKINVKLLCLHSNLKSIITLILF